MIKTPFIEKNLEMSINIRNNENIYIYIQEYSKFQFYFLNFLTQKRKKERVRELKKIVGSNMAQFLICSTWNFFLKGSFRRPHKNI